MEALFFRPFNYWMVEVMENFLARLYKKRVCGDVNNSMLWIETMCGKFSIKSFYNALELC